MGSWRVLVHKKASSYRAVHKYQIKKSMMLLVATTKMHLLNFKDFCKLAAKSLATEKQ